MGREQAYCTVSTDIVVFGILEDKLKALLVKCDDEPERDSWALPYGRLESGEGLEACAYRALRVQAGFESVYMEQLYTFEERRRDPGVHGIAVAYYALVPFDRLGVPGPDTGRTVGWFGLGALPSMARGHRKIAEMAHRRLVAKLGYSTVALQFMPESFTLSELQNAYEIIQGERLDKRNFRKWVLALGHIEKTGDERRAGNCRPAKLYRSRFPSRLEFIK